MKKANFARLQLPRLSPHALRRVIFLRSQSRSLAFAHNPGCSPSTVGNAAPIKRLVIFPLHHSAEAWLINVSDKCRRLHRKCPSCPQLSIRMLISDRRPGTASVRTLSENWRAVSQPKKGTSFQASPPREYPSRCSHPGDHLRTEYSALIDCLSSSNSLTPLVT
jgi:hypothetical protein